MPTTTTSVPDPRPLADWSQAEIDHAHARGRMIADCLSRRASIAITNGRVLDRVAEVLRQAPAAAVTQAPATARRAESP